MTIKISENRHKLFPYSIIADKFGNFWLKSRCLEPEPAFFAEAGATRLSVAGATKN